MNSENTYILIGIDSKADGDHFVQSTYVPADGNESKPDVIYTTYHENAIEFQADEALDFIEKYGPHAVINITQAKIEAAEKMANKIYEACDMLNEAIGLVQTVNREDWAETIGFDMYTDEAIGALQYAEKEMQATIDQLQDGSFEGELDYTL